MNQYPRVWREGETKFVYYVYYAGCRITLALTFFPKLWVILLVLGFFLCCWRGHSLMVFFNQVLSSLSTSPNYMARDSLQYDGILMMFFTVFFASSSTVLLYLSYVGYRSSRQVCLSVTLTWNYPTDLLSIWRVGCKILDLSLPGEKSMIHCYLFYKRQ